MLGMTMALLVDSYCALRFKDDSDKIKFTPVEKFAKQSWTEQAFEKDGNIVLQIFAVSFIFMSLFMNVMGTVQNEGLCKFILAFYVFRLIQFMTKTNLVFEMLQSNMTCIALFTISAFTFGIGGVGIYADAGAVLMLLDCVLGVAVFYGHNHKEIKE